ncbi:MAG: succinate dehydrogenase [Polyangiaceae bacterium]
MASKSVHLPVLQSGLGGTLRRDAWWVGPAITFVLLSAFVVYATWRAFENANFDYGPYLSPLYSPLIDTSWAKGWPIPVSGAMIILIGPGSFRFTCYYYRKAYYRAFAMDPPACAVGEPRGHSYKGERGLLIFQNLHRFTLYVAIFFLFCLWHDAIKALCGWQDGCHLNAGTLVLTMNAFLLSGYTLSCHAFRHLVGGNVNSYSTAKAGMLRYKLWQKVSKLNTNHMAWAWTSLFGVGLTDFYVRCVCTGAIHDMRFF